MEVPQNGVPPNHPSHKRPWLSIETYWNHGDLGIQIILRNLVKPSFFWKEYLQFYGPYVSSGRRGAQGGARGNRRTLSLGFGVSTARGFLCRPHWNGKGNHPQMAFFQVKYGKLLQFTQIYWFLSRSTRISLHIYVNPFCCFICIRISVI